MTEVEAVVVVIDFVDGVEFLSKVFRSDGFFSASFVFWGVGVSLRTEDTDVGLGWISNFSDTGFHNSSKSADVVKSLYK